jgi:choline dehydrogenase-like flavoprotein
MMSVVDSIEDVVVIGTGPAGIAAIVHLLKFDTPPIVLDSGKKMPPSALNEQAKQLLSLTEKESFDFPKSAGEYMVGQAPPLKTQFGSDYVFHQNEAVQIKTIGVDLGVSFARGGLSNVWGGSCMTFPADDIKSWPISHEELYRNIGEMRALLQLSGDLRFSTSNDYVPEFDSHRSINSIFEPMMNRSVKSGKLACVSVASCLAIDTQLAPSDVCSKCRSCLQGCPTNAIFSASTILTGLISTGLDYRPNSTVIRLEEQPDCVVITYVNDSGIQAEIKSRRVVVACGPIVSTALVLSALDENQKAELHECRAVTLPIISLRKLKSDGHGTTLTEMCVEVLNTKTNKTQVHFQCYGPSRELTNATIASARRFHLPAILARWISRRALVAHGFITPQKSTRISVQVISSQDKITIVTSATNPVRTSSYQESIRALLKFLLRGRLLVILPLAHWESVGRSYHLSSSFPMANNQDEWNSSDLVGRPRGLSRIHVVDASVLPAVPPQSPTLTVMCNSARIAEIISEYIKAERVILK